MDVERIRFAAERDAYEAVARANPEKGTMYVPRDPTNVRREILSEALLLTEAMAPDAYDAAREAMKALGVDDDVELFQSPGTGTGNARMVLAGRPIGIQFMGDYLDVHDRPGLVAIMGHEIGHAIVHSAYPVDAAYKCTREHRAFSIAKEITADRFSLLACRDLDALLRVEMRTAAGGSPRSVRLDTTAYLAQCRALAEETLARGRHARGSTHPEHYVRGYAEWLFSETDVYAAITGMGTGERSLDEVDAILRAFVDIPIVKAKTDCAPLLARFEDFARRRRGE